MLNFEDNNKLPQLISNHVVKKRHHNIQENLDYIHKKKMIIATKNKSINFYFGNNDRFYVIGATDGYCEPSKMSVLVSESFPIYLKDNLLKNEDIIKII